MAAEAPIDRGVTLKRGDRVLFGREGLQQLFDALKRRGYTLVGPQVDEQTIVYDELERVDDLPVGITDKQDGGHYRLRSRDDNAMFGYVVGPHSWKRFLNPPVQSLWRARKTQDGFDVVAADTDAEPAYAFIGVRACELAAMGIQDRVYTGGSYVDGAYQQRRSDACIIAVNCVEVGGTCFCTSMDTGPNVQEGFDVSLTELISPNEHVFLAEVGSDTGASVLEEVDLQPPTNEHVAAAHKAIADAAASMGRELDTRGLRDLLYRNYESPRWQDVAQRCLSCANCTMVCPTCFCSTVEDTSSPDGEEAARVKKWDSCFTSDFSYVVGGPVRQSTKSRYRQWMTHKLATWIDQFGSSGCVGCGRCITWCPVGIDITEEVDAIRADDSARS